MFSRKYSLLTFFNVLVLPAEKVYYFCWTPVAVLFKNRKPALVFECSNYHIQHFTWLMA